MTIPEHDFYSPRHNKIIQWSKELSIHDSKKLSREKLTKKLTSSNGNEDTTWSFEDDDVNFDFWILE